jgi:hypothetical protein
MRDPFANNCTQVTLIEQNHEIRVTEFGGMLTAVGDFFFLKSWQQARPWLEFAQAQTHFKSPDKIGAA